MTRGFSIQLKAAFLIFVFCLNTAVGFACSVGINMVVKSSHHQDEKDALIHKHDNSHTHDNANANHHQPAKTKDNCCKEEVEKFGMANKRAPQSIDSSTGPIFVKSVTSAIYHISVSELNNLVFQTKFFLRSHHPPIPEIRLAIQSFLI